MSTEPNRIVTKNELIDIAQALRKLADACDEVAIEMYELKQTDFVSTNFPSAKRGLELFVRFVSGAPGAVRNAEARKLLGIKDDGSGDESAGRSIHAQTVLNDSKEPYSATKPRGRKGSVTQAIEVAKEDLANKRAKDSKKEQ